MKIFPFSQVTEPFLVTEWNGTYLFNCHTIAAAGQVVKVMQDHQTDGNLFPFHIIVMVWLEEKPSEIGTYLHWVRKR